MFNVDDLHLNTAFKPRGDQIIVLPLLKARRGTLINMGEDREQPEKGLVLDIGPGGIGPESGRDIPIQAKVGELVAFGRYAGMAWEIEGAQGMVPVYLLRDAEVLAAQPAAAVELEMHDGDPRKIHEKGLTCEYCPRLEAGAGLERLQVIATGGDPDAPTPEPTGLLTSSR